MEKSGFWFQILKVELDPPALVAKDLSPLANYATLGNLRQPDAKPPNPNRGARSSSEPRASSGQAEEETTPIMKLRD